MFCANCSKLSVLHTMKKCSRCQSDVFNNISILCEFCSLTEKVCAACLKKVVAPSAAAKKRGKCCGK